MGILNEYSVDGWEDLTPEEVQHEMMCAELSGKIGPMILEAYPGHPWAVSVNIQGGIIAIWLGPDPERFGTIIKLTEVSTHTGPQMKRLLFLRCGELLERYGLARSAGTAEMYIDLLERAGNTGHFIKDKS